MKKVNLQNIGYNQPVYESPSTTGVLQIGSGSALSLIFANVTYGGAMTLAPPYTWLVELPSDPDAPYPNGCISGDNLLECTQPTGHFSWQEYSMDLAAQYLVLMEISTQTPWTCVASIDATGSGVPVRINSNGDVECMAPDGANCLWSSNCAATLSEYESASLDPLVCGAMHYSLYGITGYNEATHWCYLGWEALKPWYCIPSETSPVRLNPMGNVECLSTDGADCFWGTVSCSQITTYVPTVSGITPLVCGHMHESIYGITGYTTPTHWCFVSIETFEPECIIDDTVIFCSGSQCTGLTPCPLANSK